MDTPDVYEYLTNFADDKDVLQMLSVNKKFDDPVFLRRALERRYPFLLKYKTDDVSWRQFYSSMIYYIYKMKEKFLGFNVESFDPVIMNIYGIFFKSAIKYSLKTNNLSFINTFIQKLGIDGIIIGSYKPKLIKQNMIDFIKTGNFGNISGSNIGLSVQSILTPLYPLLEKGISTTIILRNLVKIYIHNNDLRKLNEKRGLNFIMINDELKRFFPGLTNKKSTSFNELNTLIITDSILPEEVNVSVEEAKILYGIGKILDYILINLQ